MAALPKHAVSETRRRAAPPNLVTLSNAFLAAVDPARPVDPQSDPRRFGAWVENACLAHAASSGQRVSYWREEPLDREMPGRRMHETSLRDPARPEAHRPPRAAPHEPAAALRVSLLTTRPAE